MTDEPHFDGDTYVHERDFKRLYPQLQKIKQYMEGKGFLQVQEIAEAVGAPENSTSAAMRSLRKKRFGSRTVSRRHEGNGLYTYKLEPTDYKEPEQKNIPEDWWKHI